MVNSVETKSLDGSFRALAHPARRTIVGRLAHGPATVAEATRGTSLSKPAITKHLHVLEDAGIVRRVVRGRTHVLSLRTNPLADAAAWIEGQRRLWERKLDIIDEFLDKETAT